MNDDSFVKIEDKKMPVDEFNYIDLEVTKNYSKGFTNFVFLSGIVGTVLLWLILIFLER